MTEKQLAKIIEEEIISELEQQESEIILECNKQLKIVNPSDTCEYAEPKERGGEK